MSGDLLCLYLAGIAVTLTVGIFYVLVTTNLVRTIIGLELVTKGATLGIVFAGHVTGRVGLAQALAITMIVVEVVIIVVAVGIAVTAHRRNGSLDARLLRNVKG